ncbi:MAG: glycosyltransferase family 4 protein [Limnothrix sp.]
MNRPKLTIFFQLDPWNPTIGGIQTCISYVLKYAPDAFDIQLVGITSDRQRIGQWRQAELHGRSFKFLPLLCIADDNVRSLIPTTLKYAWALRKYRLDSDFLQFHRIEPTFVAKGWKGHKILYIHNDIFQEVKGGSNRGGILWKRFPWAYFALEKRLVTQFNSIFSCNSNAARLYKENYPAIADRVSYLPNTFDSELFYPLSGLDRNQGRQALAQKLGLADQTQFILFAGRLHPQKDPSLLVRSMAALKDPNAHLLIVGKGELKGEIVAELHQLGISERVTLMGPVKQTELADLYRISEMFVLTSAYEGLARGSLEALACGTPVVTTRAGETPNFLDPDSGIVCDERDPVVIAADWDRVLQQRELFPSEACVRVASPYQASKVVKDLYGGLLQHWQANNREESG